MKALKMLGNFLLAVFLVAVAYAYAVIFLSLGGYP